MKSYLLEMPRGHIFDLAYRLFADVFPPGEPDVAAREKLRVVAEECGRDVVSSTAEDRYELTLRAG